MKMNELVVMESGKWLSCHAQERDIFHKYKNKENVVVAYYKDFFGSVFVIKGSIKFFGLISIRGGVAPYPLGLKRYDLSFVYNLLQESNGMVVLEQEKFEQLQKQLLIESMGKESL
jgi:hypothetical protein